MKRRVIMLGAILLMVMVTMGTDCVQAQTKPIKIGVVSIFSGRFAMLGQQDVNGMSLVAEDINARGGLLGRPIEIVHQDSKGKVEDAVKIARDFIERDKVDFLFDASTTREAFAIKEVTRDLKFLTFVTAAETTEFTADPKQFCEYSFRTSRQSIHDMVVCALFDSEIAKKDKLTKWYAIIPDYAFGRDQMDVFFTHLKKYYPDVQVLGAVYPKLFEPDYSPHITTILGARPQALFSVVWGGDGVALFKQGKVYGLFDQVRFFQNEMTHFVNTGELKEVPEGFPSSIRHTLNCPDTKENREFFERYVKKFGTGPVHWAYEASAGLLFLEGAVKKAGRLDHTAVAQALRGLTVKSFWGHPPNNTITMRASDQTCINYTLAGGYSTSKPPYFRDIKLIDWDYVLKEEKSYLQQKGWLK